MTCRFILKIAAVLIVLGLVPEVGAAQLLKCTEREAIVENLKEKYNEKPVSYGMTTSGTVMEIFVSPIGSWTMVVSHPVGLSCYTAFGDEWTILPIINDDEKGKVL